MESEQELDQIKASQRDLKDFAPLYDKYYTAIFRFIFKRVSNEQNAADLTQQVFLKAMMNIRKYQDRGFPFSAWLYRIAINEVNMFYRKQKKDVHVSISGMEIREMMLEIDEEDREFQLQHVVDQLNELPQEKSQLIDLRFFEKCSYKEIGEIYGITEANAKMRVRRTLQSIKRAISPNQPNEEI